MKIILIHLALALSFSIGLALFYFKGFSQTTFYVTVIMVVGVAVFEIGMKYGFNKPLPREKTSEVIVRIIRYGFGIALYSGAKNIMDRRLFETLLRSKNFVVVLWLWMIFEIFVHFQKE